MKRENWSRVESYLDDIATTLNGLDNSDIEVPEAVSDIRNYAEDIYTICEDDYYNSADEDICAEYDEIIAILPDTKLSLAEILSLKETIQKWRDEHGYPNP